MKYNNKKKCKSLCYAILLIKCSTQDTNISWCRKFKAKNQNGSMYIKSFPFL